MEGFPVSRLVNNPRNDSEACIQAMGLPAAGVSRIKAKLMYGAVYAAGPRWEVITSIGLEGEEKIIMDQESPGISSVRLDQLNDRIAADDISLEEIERFIDSTTGE